ncbi:unnamed protein product [Effrenium voratum]|nr:unnamed protein product [Effrenium voratum]
MPLRSHLWELFTWQKGGPDGDRAFSSLSPVQSVPRKEMRPTQHMKLLRSIMSGNTELGAPLCSLLQERGRCAEPKAKASVKEPKRFPRLSVVEPPPPLCGSSLPEVFRQLSGEGEGSLQAIWSRLTSEQSQSEKLEVQEALVERRPSDASGLDENSEAESEAVSELMKPSEPMSRHVSPAFSTSSAGSSRMSRKGTSLLITSKQVQSTETAQAQDVAKRKLNKARLEVSTSGLEGSRTLPRTDMRKGMSFTKPKKSGSRKGKVVFGAEAKGTETAKKPKKTALPFKVISWSSQKRSFRSAAQNLEKQEDDFASGNQWETDASPEHLLVLDFGSEVELSCLKLRCTGTPYDPKSVTVMRGICGIAEVVDEHIFQQKEAQRPVTPIGFGVLARGTWAVLKRASLKSGPDGRDKHQHSLHFPGAQTRFLKLIFHESWSSTGNIRLLQPLTVYGGPLTTPRRKLSLTVMFNERLLLDEVETETRKMARKYGIPIDYTTNVRKEFARFDSERRGFLNYADFKQVVRSLTTRHVQKVSLQENHLRALWSIVDKDGSGCVDFEEFLQWFYTHFQKEKPPAMSLHSDDLVDTVTEHFYASMGVNRLRCYVSTQEGEVVEEAFPGRRRGQELKMATQSAVKKAWLRKSLAAAAGH